MLELVVRDPFDPAVARTWQRLEAAASPSYFLSWGWLESWLACVPRDAAPRFVELVEGGATIAACFVGQRRVRRHGLARTVLYVNATGDQLCDDLCVEHNGLVRAPGSQLGLDALVTVLAEAWPDEWDELHVPATDRGALAELAPLSGYEIRVARDEVAPYVDLDLVRAVDGGYPAVLAPAARVQLHRSRHALGPLELVHARDERTALDMYDELLALPDRRGPALDHAWYTALHRRLIGKRLRHGELRLARVRAAGETVGVAYGFAYAGKAIAYQLGCTVSDDPHVKPAFLCHAAAIEHAAREGQAIYDLGPTDAAHALALATGAARALWLTIERPVARSAIRHALSGWRHRAGAEPRARTGIDP